MLRNAGLVLLSLVITIACYLGVGEVVIRFFFPEQRIVLSPADAERKVFDHALGTGFAEDAHLPFRLVPGHYDIAEGRTITINSDGFRGAELRKPKAPVRVLFLGDSYVYGYGVDDRETLPRQLEAELRRRRPALDVEVINAGFHGSCPVQYDLFLRTTGLALRPDFVFVAVLPDNDISDFAYTRFTAFDGDGRPTQVTDGLVSYEGRRYYRGFSGLVDLPVLRHSVAWLNLLRSVNLVKLSVEQQDITGDEARAFFAHSLDLVESDLRGIPHAFVLLPGGRVQREGRERNPDYVFVKETLLRKQLPTVNLGPALFRMDAEELRTRFHNELGEYSDDHYNGVAHRAVAPELAASFLQLTATHPNQTGRSSSGRAR